MNRCARCGLEIKKLGFLERHEETCNIIPEPKELHRLLVKGKTTIEAIASFTGVSPYTVRDFAKRAGIPREARSMSKRLSRRFKDDGRRRCICGLLIYKRERDIPKLLLKHGQLDWYIDHGGSCGLCAKETQYDL